MLDGELRAWESDAMEPYKHRIFVCTNNREGEKSSCTLRSSAATLACLKKEIAERGLEFDVKVVPSGCLGLCEQGPNLIVYPEGKWYSGVSTEHVKDFVDMAVVKDQTYAPCAWNDQKLQKFFDEKTARKKMGGASKASSI